MKENLIKFILNLSRVVDALANLRIFSTWTNDTQGGRGIPGFSRKNRAEGGKV